MTVRDLVQTLLKYDLNSDVEFLCECSNEQLKELNLENGEELSATAKVEDIDEYSRYPFSDYDKVRIDLRIEL